MKKSAKSVKVLMMSMANQINKLKQLPGKRKSETSNSVPSARCTVSYPPPVFNLFSFLRHHHMDRPGLCLLPEGDFSGRIGIHSTTAPSPVAGTFHEIKTPQENRHNTHWRDIRCPIRYTTNPLQPCIGSIDLLDLSRPGPAVSLVPTRRFCVVQSQIFLDFFLFRFFPRLMQE